MLTVSIVIKSMPEVYIRRLLSQGTLGLWPGDALGLEATTDTSPYGCSQAQR